MSDHSFENPGYEDGGAKHFVIVYTIAALVVIAGLVAGLLW